MDLLSSFLDVSIAASLILGLCVLAVCLVYFWCNVLRFAFWPNTLNKQIDDWSKCTQLLKINCSFGVILWGKKSCNLRIVFPFVGTLHFASTVLRVCGVCPVLWGLFPYGANLTSLLECLLHRVKYCKFTCSLIVCILFSWSDREKCSTSDLKSQHTRKCKQMCSSPVKMLLFKFAFKENKDWTEKEGQWENVHLSSSFTINLWGFITRLNASLVSSGKLDSI